tara:strand:- start:2810 stop:3310 length:501 start_codon:yes stop_codon:yes gene_type:complete
MAKNTGRNLILFAVAAIVLLIFLNCVDLKKISMYSPAPVTKEAVVVEVEGDDEGELASVEAPQQSPDVCALKNGGTGLASALLPKETATQEDFGEFSPDEILQGQNFLDPRDQIGFPETAGGALRNANQQIRSEPPNPRDAVTIFNTSTIAPDQMRPPFEIGSGLA